MGLSTGWLGSGGSSHRAVKWQVLHVFERREHGVCWPAGRGCEGETDVKDSSTGHVGETGDRVHLGLMSRIWFRTG